MLSKRLSAIRRHVAAFISTTTLLSLPSTLSGQEKRPVLIYDEAHNNFSSDGPIAELLRIAHEVGFEVRTERRPLDQVLASGAQLLVICVPAAIPNADFVARFAAGQSGATGAARPMFWTPDVAQPGFSDVEIQSVVGWVENGGGLFLIVDHAPVGAVAGSLARALGAELRSAFTWDGLHAPPGYTLAKRDARQGSWIYFDRAGGMIGKHPITSGTSDHDRVNSVVTYTGSSIQGPIGSTALLLLSDSATDYYKAWGDGPEYRLPAAGRSQAVAYHRGRGRVVIAAEAGMLMRAPFGEGHPRDPEMLGVGIEYARGDNRQFARNILRWLGGALEHSSSR